MDGFEEGRPGIGSAFFYLEKESFHRGDAEGAEEDKIFTTKATHSTPFAAAQVAQGKLWNTEEEQRANEFRENDPG